MEASKHFARMILRGVRRARSGQEGYVLILAMLILMAMGMASATLLVSAIANQQHSTRDRAYTQSLAVAEAGLNQYLWMLASGASSISNNWGIPGNTGPDSHVEQLNLTDIYDHSVQGTYAIKVIPPGPDNSNVQVIVSGKAASTTDVPRTVYAQLGRPSFSQYVMLSNDYFHIGGPLERVWYGKTHSNTQIEIDTKTISDTISCANASYGGNPGVFSTTVPSGDISRSLWSYPVPAVDFNTVTSDFNKLSTLAVGNGVNIPYSTTYNGNATHDGTQGWYIKLLPGSKYQIMRVTAESETTSGSGGSLTTVTPTSPVPSGQLSYPTNGVIYVNDNVWVEGTNVDGRITIACSGQLNPSGKTAATSIHIVGNLTYSHKDGTVAVGLIAQNNIEVPRYAPLGAALPVSGQDMEIDAAVIAQTGKESCNAADALWSSYGPIRDMLTIYGAVASYHKPYRYVVDYGGNILGGFSQGENIYDPYLLHNPPPYTPVVGSYQILSWRELPNTQGVPIS